MILHISDLHIGEGRKIPNYIERYKKVLWQVIDKIKERDIKHLLISGDIFHRSDLHNLEKDLVIEWFGYLNLLNIPVYIINGQHDIINPKYTHLDTCHHLIKTESWKNINLITKEPTFFKEDGFNLLAIPWDEQLSEEKLRTLLAKYTTEEQLIVMAHVMVKNTTNSSGYTLPGGITLPNDIPNVSWALGDIHNRHKGENWWYAGSILQHTWGDKEKNYGGVLIKQIYPLNIEDINFDYKPLITLNHDEFDMDNLPDAWIKVIKDNQTIPIDHPNILKYVNKKLDIEENVTTTFSSFTTNFKEEVLSNFSFFTEDTTRLNKTLNWLLQKL